MITESLLAIVMGSVEWFAGLVPDFGLDLSTLDLTSVWQSLGSGVAALNGWVPALVALGCLGTLLSVQVGVSGWGLLVWVYHQFWGSE